MNELSDAAILPRPVAWVLANPVRCLLLLALLIGGVGFTMNSCQRRGAQERAAEAEAGAIVATGQAAAARDAQRITIDVVNHERAIDAQTMESRNEILSAAGAGDSLPTGVAAAGRRALCMRAAYRGEPACEQLRHADP